jgi:hypothetical protein
MHCWPALSRSWRVLSMPLPSLDSSCLRLQLMSILSPHRLSVHGSSGAKSLTPGSCGGLSEDQRAGGRRRCHFNSKESSIRASAGWGQDQDGASVRRLLQQIPSSQHGQWTCCSLMSRGKGRALLTSVMHARVWWTMVMYASVCCLGRAAHPWRQHRSVPVLYCQGANWPPWAAK